MNDLIVMVIGVAVLVAAIGLRLAWVVVDQIPVDPT